MGTWTFTVDEPLMGFIAHAKPWTDKAKRYVGFKGKVRLLATIAGVPEEIPAGYRAKLSIAVAWKKKARVDLSNILKAVEDGLWVRDRGIGEFHATKLQHTGMERVSVTVWMEGEQNGKPIKNRKQQA
jgi:Holliday junction resolvase RusA-like endonuclease